MKSFDAASVVGIGLPDNAKYDLVVTCNMVTDLGTKVDDDGIALPRSFKFSNAVTFKRNYPYY